MKTFECICCQKRVCYDNRFSSMNEASLKKRIEKSGLSEEEFMATFTCKACSKSKSVVTIENKTSSSKNKSSK